MFKIFGSLSLIIILFSCQTSNVQQVMNELQNMKSPDYSQIKKLQLSEHKSQIENSLMEFYDADTAILASTGIFKYGADTTILISQWLKASFVNSMKITDLQDKELTDKLAIEIGTYLKPKVLNIQDYDKMEIMFINEIQTEIKGATKSIKQSIHLSIPELELIN